MSQRWWMLGLLLLGLVGCVQPFTAFRTAEETERDNDLDVRTIGDVTDIDNVAPLQLSGVGLVTGLDGTGGTSKSMYRDLLEKDLMKRKVEHVSQVFANRDNALVLISATMPSGTRKGDPLDLEVGVPPGSPAVSLRGGYLEICYLKEVETTKGLSPQSKGPNELKFGHEYAKAKGPLLVGLDGANDEMDPRHGNIWEGGTSLADRPLRLRVKKDTKFIIKTNTKISARLANAVVDRINFVFQDDADRQRLSDQRSIMYVGLIEGQINQKTGASDRGEVARAATDDIVNIRLPYAYRFNPERYLRVVRLMPLAEFPDEQKDYRRRLQKMLLDPATTMRAALRLEALGKDGIPLLKQGLENDHPLVRFAAAESLTYLGSTAGVETLANLTRDNSMLQTFGLMALSSQEESASRAALAGMLSMEDPQLRCSAFRAIRAVDDRDAHIRGEFVGQAFWVHKVAPNSPQLVSFSTSKRAEIVLFGKNISLVAPVKILAGPDITITTEVGDDRCTISRVTLRETSRKQCSLALDDVLRTMVELGSGYAEAVDLLRKLDERHGLNCPIVSNLFPPQVSVETLAESGRNPSFLK